jgi:hypothetical protein
LTADAHRRLSWLRALPLLTRYIIRSMPWVTLITGCLAGLAIFTILVRVAHHDQATFWLDQGTIRLSLLPVAAALAFVPSVPFRPLTRATPVPAWVTPAAHLLLAVPILALTFWAQLRIMAPVILPHAPQDPHEPFYALIAQLIGWSAIIVAAAACTARSRFADLGGAIAAPISFAVIALAWYTPLTAKFLVKPPAIPHSIAIGWYAVAAAALILTCAAMRDHWHRYTRGLHRLPSLTRLLGAGIGPSYRAQRFGRREAGGPHRRVQSGDSADDEGGAQTTVEGHGGDLHRPVLAHRVADGRHGAHDGAGQAAEG